MEIVKEEIMQKSRERLKELREEKGLSTEELGEIVGASAKEIERWEAMPGIMPWYYLPAFTALYCVSCEYICGLSDIKYTEEIKDYVRSQKNIVKNTTRS